MQVKSTLHLVWSLNSITCISHVDVVRFVIIILYVYFSQLCVDNAYNVKHKFFQIQLLALC